MNQFTPPYPASQTLLPGCAARPHFMAVSPGFGLFLQSSRERGVNTHNRHDNPSSTRACFGVCFSQSLFSSRALTARRYSPSVTGRRATSPRKVAAIPLVTTHGSSARSATLTEHGATRIPELLRRLRRRGKCAWGSRGQGDGNRRPVVLCRPWGPRPPRPRSPQRPPRLLPASAAFQAGSRCVEVWFCLRMWGSALERHFQARGDGRAASRGGSGRRSP